MLSESVSKETLRQAQILWDYLKLNQPFQKADCIIAMGSHDLHVGEYAASLFLDQWAPLLVCSGGLGRLTQEIWEEPEARKFAGLAKNLGVPAEKILIEEKSTNTAENLIFTRDLLKEKGYSVKKAILVHKPYMERRVLATVGIIWPGLRCVITSPPIPFHEYPTTEIPLQELIQIMVGDFQRLIVYAEKGFQTPQKISSNAMESFKSLVSQGFDKYLVKE